MVFIRELRKQNYLETGTFHHNKIEWFQPFMKKGRVTVLSAPTIPFLPKSCFSIISFHFLTKLVLKQVRLDL